MAVAFISQSSSVDEGTTPEPAGLVSTSVMAAFVICGGPTATITFPSGFTSRKKQSLAGIGTIEWATGVRGTIGAGPYAITADDGGPIGAGVWIGGYSGVDNTSQVDSGSGAPTSNTASGTGQTVSWNGLTVTSNGSYLLCGVKYDYQTQNLSTPSGFTARTTAQVDSHSVYDKSSNSGATGTITDGTGDNCIMAMICLVPDGGGGGVTVAPRRTLLGVGRRELTREERGGRIYSLPAPGWERTRGGLYVRQVA